MKTLLLIPLIALLAIATLLPASVAEAGAKKTICKTLIGESYKYKKQTAMHQIEVSGKKMTLVRARQEARDKTNDYNRAKRQGKKAAEEYRKAPSLENRLRLDRAVKRFKSAEKRSLSMGRVVKKLEGELKASATALRTAKQALKQINKEIKRNNCR